MMQVKKITRETVHPAAPSPGGNVQLIILDQVFPDMFSSILLFFTQKPLLDASALLKAALAETLTLFYPCAGRLRETINGEREIVCNDEGAVFFEAWVDRKVDDFMPHFNPCADFALLMPKLAPFAENPHTPLMFAQVTHFECGRICLGFGMHHSVGDGLSGGHFMSTWAALTYSKGTSDLHTQVGAQLGFRPYIDRSLLKAHVLPSAPSEQPDYHVAPTFRTDQLAPCPCKLFYFTPSFIDAVRVKASPNASTPEHSRFQALAAHLWRGAIYAKSLAPEKDVSLAVPVEGRRLFKPPLPEGFFGNVVFHCYAACKAGELADEKSGLPFAADLVKAGIASVTDAHMRSTLDWVATQKSPKCAAASLKPGPGIDILINSWLRLPFGDLDFGWGKPSSVRIPSDVLDEAIIFLLPSSVGPGHVDALVALQAEHMLKFEEFIIGNV